MFILYSCAGTALIATTSNRHQGIRSTSLYSFLLFLISISIWSVLSEMPNWVAINLAMRQYPAFSITAALLLQNLCWYWLFSHPIGPHNAINRFFKWQHHRIFSLFPFFIFLILAFRWDSFFLGSSALHWEYFVGPIRTLRQGSILLWDTPSQYGFLNLLLPSLLPTSSSWQALYLFQGALLFIASSLAYLAILSCAPQKKIFAFLITAASVFFADPSLVGPSLYPSSSVMRFFWCYVFLFLISKWMDQKINVPNKILFSLGACAWLAGVSWSFESAIYCSSIYFFMFTADTLLTLRNQDKFKDFKCLQKIFKSLLLRFGFTFLSLIMLIALITIYYHFQFNLYPDWSMFYEHAFYYAVGFGSTPIPIIGAGCIFLCVFISIASTPLRGAITNSIQSQKIVTVFIGLLGCVVGISTYYLGRAYPSNVVALLPLIILILSLSLKAHKTYSNSLPSLIAITVIPVFFLTLMSNIGTPSFSKTALNIKSLSSNVEQRLPIADSELVELILQANISPEDRVIYYGYTTAMPSYYAANGDHITFDITWQPNPLQIIEEPISADRRIKAISRFSERGSSSGYFIQAKGQNEDRASEWRSIFSKYSIEESIFESKNYRIIKFRRI